MPFQRAALPHLFIGPPKRMARMPIVDWTGSIKNDIFWRARLEDLVARKSVGTSEIEVEMRIVILAAAMLLLSGFTQAELEKAKNTKEFFKDSYWKCLATEIVRVVPTNMSVQDFSIFARGACQKERSDFFLSLSDYIVMLHPDIDRNTVPSAANIAVKAAQDDAVKVLIDLRSGNQGK
jgi:hypothetical protein